MHNAPPRSRACPSRSPVGRRVRSARARVRSSPALSIPEQAFTMSMTPAKIEAFERAALKSDLPDFRVGDTIAVHYKIVEGDKLRVQIFRGIVIKRHRAGASSTVT